MGSRLQNRVAVVTGAGRGIGRAVALLLAQEGASVVVNDMGGAVDGSEGSQAPADEVVAAIRQNGVSAIPNYDSVAEYDSAGRIVQSAIDEYGRLDILCNAAGILRDRMVFNMSEEEWDAVIRVHLYGAFNMVRHCVPHMAGRRYGRIALFSSVSGLGSTGQANYSAAKEGMVGMARALADELRLEGVTVNAVYPGGHTRMMASVPEATRQRLREAARMNPGAFAVAELVASPEPDEAMTPESNAAKIVYLCTEAGGAISGQVIGTHGWSMSRYSRRRPTKSIHKDGAWTLDELERLLPISLGAGILNPAPPSTGPA